MESLYTLARGNKSPSNLTPVQLRALVLGYLCHECYSKTAKAFAKDSAVRHLDADGDEIQADKATSMGYELGEEDLKQVELREEIRIHILSGQVDEATEMLNEHFPFVLSGSLPEPSTPTPSDKPRLTDGIEYVSSTSVDPAHLTLNLRILAFIEACRTIPLVYPPSAEATHTPNLESSNIDDGSPASLEIQLALLSKAQKLLALASRLPKRSDRELYIKELTNVGGLLAYKVPETSSISMYLSQERREAVADQINRAILERSGLPSASLLEILTRNTSTAWSFAHQLGVKPKPGAPIPPSARPQNEQEVVPPFDLQHFLDSRT